MTAANTVEMAVAKIRARVGIDEAGCWLVSGPVDHGGYARICLQGRRVGAHRLFYEFYVGPIPDGLTVDHLCFVPRCVNPDHLRVLTNLENASNQRSATKPRCVAGHAFDEKNTRWKLNRKGQGRRDCRTCNAEAVARYRARRRLERAS